MDGDLGDESVEPYVSVRHCLLVRQGKRDESWLPASSADALYVLRGVGYSHSVAPDTEFPTVSAPPWAVYLRLTGGNVGPMRVLFRVHYWNESARWEHLDRREMDQTLFFPEAGEGTRDVLLNLPYLRLGGIGLHAISAHFWYDGFQPDESARLRAGVGDEVPEWATEPEEQFGTSEWAFGAVEYFWITRQS